MFRILAKENIKYSQSSIKPTFSDDGHTPVNTWIDAEPYNVPLEVLEVVTGQYLSLDNRRLYSAKNYGLAEQLVRCVVHQIGDVVTDSMEKFFLDLVSLLLVNQGVYYQLDLRATTVEAVSIIRCACQNYSFPLTGTFDNPVISDERTYDQMLYNLHKPRYVTSCVINAQDYLEVVSNSEEIFIRVGNVNLYHKQIDLKQLILSRTELFDVESLKILGGQFTLRARGEESDDYLDNEKDWKELLAYCSELEQEREDSYQNEFYKNIERFCSIVEYNLSGAEFSGAEILVRKSDC
eukprot:gene18015-23654_t